MGTNYYLHKKCNYDGKYPSVVGDDVCFSYHEVQELENGYVWHNKYFKDVKELNKEYYITIHIGKASYGWKFALCIYPDKYSEQTSYELNFDGSEENEYSIEYLLPKPILTLDDWKELFDDQNCSIFDEYGDEVSTEEMIKIINTKNSDDIKSRRLEKYAKILENENYDLVLSGNNPAKCCVFC